MPKNKRIGIENNKTLSTQGSHNWCSFKVATNYQQQYLCTDEIL